MPNIDREAQASIRLLHSLPGSLMPTFFGAGISAKDGEWHQTARCFSVDVSANSLKRSTRTSNLVGRPANRLAEVAEFKKWILKVRQRHVFADRNPVLALLPLCAKSSTASS